MLNRNTILGSELESITLRLSRVISVTDWGAICSDADHKLATNLINDWLTILHILITEVTDDISLTMEGCDGEVSPDANVS